MVMIAAAHVKRGADVRIEGETWRVVHELQPWGFAFGLRDGVVLRFTGVDPTRGFATASAPRSLLRNHQPTALNVESGWRYFAHGELLEVVA